MTLPVMQAVPGLLDALARCGMAVLHAPPGAGKTTAIPLALLEAGAFEGRLIMLEPRRLAARAAAQRMAEVLGTPLGEIVGYRMRGETQVSKQTRIEVVTEGILTAMLQRDPSLDGVGAVIFDEFHERSLNADLGLALVLEARAALREDLKLIVMSATLDAVGVSELMENAPVVSAPGQSFAVETIWRTTPPDAKAPIEIQVTPLIFDALAQQKEGSVLVFLPGAGEIARVERRLAGHVPANIRVLPLYGAMPFAAQRAATAQPKPGERHIVLATSIAETSLTLPDVRAVVDAGLARRARFDPARGMSALVTERVTKAEATQRAGRAGRVATGVCFRNWTKGAEGALAAFPPPEISIADLTSLALELAQWGDPMGADLAFLTPPPGGPLRRAQDLLTRLGALENGQITEHGTRLAALPLHPRLGHMLVSGGKGSATLAAYLSGGRRAGEARGDLSEALRNLPADVSREAKRLRRYEAGPVCSLAQQAALAFPDRIGLRRKGDAPRWLLANGVGAEMQAGAALAHERMIVAVDLDGAGRNARVREGIGISEATFRVLYADQLTWENRCSWDPIRKRVQAVTEERFGALVLASKPWPDAPQDQIIEALVEGVRSLGLSCLDWSKAATHLRARLAFGGQDVSDDHMLANLETWLAPFLLGLMTADDLSRLDPSNALRAWIGWAGMAELDRVVPETYQTPLGRHIPINYAGGIPEVQLRLQEVLGETVHPLIGPARLPLRMVLLSPGHKPIQVTQDLPGFWKGSYAEVRKEMRGRYPKHFWPEDPSEADPTLRTKAKM